MPEAKYSSTSYDAQPADARLAAALSRLDRHYRAIVHRLVAKPPEVATSCLPGALRGAERAAQLVVRVGANHGVQERSALVEIGTRGRVGIMGRWRSGMAP